MVTRCYSESIEQEQMVVQKEDKDQKVISSCNISIVVIVRGILIGEAHRPLGG